VLPRRKTHLRRGASARRRLLERMNATVSRWRRSSRRLAADDNFVCRCIWRDSFGFVGTCQLAEGGDVVGRHLVIVEDVVTSGGQIIDSCQRLRALGATVGTAICVIDREAGGVQNLATESVELRSLLTMSELQPDARPTS
jgi:orotate phosphoribosyltransferase